MTEIVGICENCDLPILGHKGQKKRNKHISRDVCFEIMRALIPQLKAENAQLRDQLQASNENLKLFVEKDRHQPEWLSQALNEGDGVYRP
jgi:hypothetical protein